MSDHDKRLARKLEVQVEELRKESEGRLRALNQISEERTIMWRRAEQAEAEVEQLKAEVEKLRTELAKKKEFFVKMFETLGVIRGKMGDAMIDMTKGMVD